MVLTNWFESNHHKWFLSADYLLVDFFCSTRNQHAITSWDWE